MVFKSDIAGSITPTQEWHCSHKLNSHRNPTISKSKKQASGPRWTKRLTSRSSLEPASMMPTRPTPPIFHRPRVPISPPLPSDGGDSSTKPMGPMHRHTSRSVLLSRQPARVPPTRNTRALLWSPRRFALRPKLLPVQTLLGHLFLFQPCAVDANNSLAPISIPSSSSTKIWRIRTRKKTTMKESKVTTAGDADTLTMNARKFKVWKSQTSAQWNLQGNVEASWPLLSGVAFHSSLQPIFESPSSLNI